MTPDSQSASGALGQRCSRTHRRWRKPPQWILFAGQVPAGWPWRGKGLGVKGIAGVEEETTREKGGKIARWNEAIEFPKVEDPQARADDAGPRGTPGSVACVKCGGGGDVSSPVSLCSVVFAGGSHWPAPVIYIRLFYWALQKVLTFLNPIVPINLLANQGQCGVFWSQIVRVAWIWASLNIGATHWFVLVFVFVALARKIQRFRYLNSIFNISNCYVSVALHALLRRDTRADASITRLSVYSASIVG